MYTELDHLRGSCDKENWEKRQSSFCMILCKSTLASYEPQSLIYKINEIMTHLRGIKEDNAVSCRLQSSI